MMYDNNSPIPISIGLKLLFYISFCRVWCVLEGDF